MWTVLLFLFIGVGSLTALAVLSACMLAGQVDHDQHVIEQIKQATNLSCKQFQTASTEGETGATSKQRDSPAFAS